MPNNLQNYQAHETHMLVEVLDQAEDLLLCSYLDNFNYCDPCAACDNGAWHNNGFFSEEECRKDNFKITTNPEGLGATECAPACEKTIEVYKPYNLQTTPWDHRKLHYHFGRGTAIDVSYKYEDVDRRIAHYQGDTPLCKEGEHQEWIWPPYQARIGSPPGVLPMLFAGQVGAGGVKNYPWNDGSRPEERPANFPIAAGFTESHDYVPGDKIRISRQNYAKQMIYESDPNRKMDANRSSAVAMNQYSDKHPKAVSAHEAITYSTKWDDAMPTPIHARAAFAIDLNVDGRVWKDDCGQVVAQGGGAVWV